MNQLETSFDQLVIVKQTTDSSIRINFVVQGRAAERDRGYRIRPEVVTSLIFCVLRIIQRLTCQVLEPVIMCRYEGCICTLSNNNYAKPCL